jgi:hypothetical protein
MGGGGGGSASQTSLFNLHFKGTGTKIELPQANNLFTDNQLLPRAFRPQFCVRRRFKHSQQPAVLERGGGGAKHYQLRGGT